MASLFPNVTPKISISSVIQFNSGTEVLHNLEYLPNTIVSDLPAGGFTLKNCYSKICEMESEAYKQRKWLKKAKNLDLETKSTDLKNKGNNGDHTSCIPYQSSTQFCF